MHIVFMVLFVSTIIVGGYIYLCSNFPEIKTTFGDYIVGVLSLLVMVLMGWNIYTVIDLKELKNDFNSIKYSNSREINYIHNKADYNQAITYLSISSSYATIISSDSLVNSKYEMLVYGASALKILSNLKCVDESNKCVGIILSAVKATPENKLSLLEYKNIRDMLLEIPDIKRIKGLYELITIIEDEIRKESVGK